MNHIAYLKRVLEDKKISISELSKTIGKAKSVTYGYLSGRVNMSMEMYLKICDILEIDPAIPIKSDDTFQSVEDQQTPYGIDYKNKYILALEKIDRINDENKKLREENQELRESLKYEKAKQTTGQKS